MHSACFTVFQRGSKACLFNTLFTQFCNYLIHYLHISKAPNVNEISAASLYSPNAHNIFMYVTMQVASCTSLNSSATTDYITYTIKGPVFNNENHPHSLLRLTFPNDRSSECTSMFGYSRRALLACTAHRVLCWELFSVLCSTASVCRRLASPCSSIDAQFGFSLSLARSSQDSL